MVEENTASDYHLEKGCRLQLDFDKLGKVARTGASVLPVVVQDAVSGEVLILAYANELALQHTIETGTATFWSTSRNELWIKGATSGDTLQIDEIRVNCEQNSVLYLVRLMGKGACHTKGAEGRARRSCYYRRLKDGLLELIEP